MFDFFIKKRAIKSAQKFINKLQPSVNVHLHDELPLPSVKVIKKLSVAASQINALEEQISALSDDQLRSKTEEFRSKFPSAVEKEKNDLDALDKLYKEAGSQEEKDDLLLQIEKAQETYNKAKQKYFDSILTEAFAVVREAGKRVLNMRHFDVQLIGGMVLNDGNIAEMTTGEGKTLVATLPAYLNALTGEGVHAE